MKETEFDRYERMKKLERKAEVEKHKSEELEEGKKIKRHRQKTQKKHNWNDAYALTASSDEYEYM